MIKWIKKLLSHKKEKENEETEFRSKPDIIEYEDEMIEHYGLSVFESENFHEECGDR